MPEKLEHSHDPSAIAARLARGPRASYLPDAVYGAIDGTITTFAVVSGAIGADLSARIVLILGAANLLADGFSMAAGNYTASKAAAEQASRLRAQEERHIALDAKGETDEVREIFRNKGYVGEALETLTRLVVSRRNVWIDLMLSEEYGLAASSRSPTWAAGVTFIAFAAAGLVPLAPFALGMANAPVIAITLTAVVFVLIGSLKSRWSDRSWWASGLETLGIGLIAAAVAYLVGILLARLI